MSKKSEKQIEEKDDFLEKAKEYLSENHEDVQQHVIQNIWGF